MIKQIARFEPGHDDLIHSISYDFYGTKLATCSTDHKIKIFSFNSSKLNWSLVESWKAHEASILKVCWAHPEFGTIIASCSSDRTVRIFEEAAVDNNFNGPTIPSNGRRWVERAKLVESKAPVMDIQFSPSHLGLKLATISSDGYVRIYEAMDIINLSSWSCMAEIMIEGSILSKDGFQEGFCLSWCTTRFLPPQLAIGCGSDKTIRILRSDHTTDGKYQFKEKFPLHDGPIHSVCWAPNLGRTYELVATGSKDTKVRLFKLSDPSIFSTEQDLFNGFEIEMIAMFDDHSLEVWKVEFNILGTILASSGDDGKVLIFKASHGIDWKCMSIISADPSIASSNMALNGQEGFDFQND